MIAPELLPELIEPILILAAIRVTRGSNVPGMNDLLAVTFNLEPVARFIFPYLPHAWPLATPASHGRIDVLEKARLLQLIPAPLAAAAAAAAADADTNCMISSIVRAAIQFHAGHVHVLRWVAKHWPEFISADWHAAQVATQNAANLGSDRGVAMLDFWTYEATVDGTRDRTRLYEVLFETHNVRTAQDRAFANKNPAVIRWWADHARFNWQVGRHWNADWVDFAMMNGRVDIVSLCADLEEAGKVCFLRPLPVVSPSAFGIVQVQALDAEGSAVEGRLVRLADSILDCASDYGVVEVLRFWKRRHDESNARKSTLLVFTERAMDLAPRPEVLDWWLNESGLPLKYTFRALHYATAKGYTAVLDWWLAQYRAHRIQELKYDEWIMTIASVHCAFDRETGQVVGIYKDDQFSSRQRASILDWWDKSGLNLKLPKAPHDSSRHMSDDDAEHASTAAIPSPIDMCTYPNVLGWWLNRARRLQALKPNSSLQSHFPPYSTTAIHRAVYWCSTRTLEWWFRYGGALAGLELLYAPHRPMELAAMGNISAFPSSLEWWCTTLPVKFRGNLLEWARFRRSPATPGFTENEAGDQVPREWELERLKALCMRFGISVDGGGGLPPPKGGYVMQERGEEFVFFPLKS